MLLDIGNVDVSRVNGVIGSRLLMLKGIAWMFAILGSATMSATFSWRS